MKTIGLIGGMSWESSAVYYQLINREVQETLGGLHSARTLMFSVDFDEIAALQRDGNWAEIGRLMIDAARRLAAGGAEMILICANTIHIVADAVEKSVDIPLIHIGDAVGEAIKTAGLKKVGLLGTRYTMELDFLKDRLSDRFGIETIIPDKDDRDGVHAIIYDELVKGQIKDESRATYLEIIDRLTANGAEAIILGCTEIPLLVGSADTDAVLFDTTRLHAERAVELAID